MEELNTGAPIYVTAHPAAWRVEVVDDGLHRGFEYVRSSVITGYNSTSGMLTLYISFY